MKVAGIVAEYNPFHNGHAYHIEATKKQSKTDYCICIMSGNFVQRGAPAIFDKYARTQMALLGGADLVLEMPAAAAVSSAEIFARCGVAILNALGVVTHLSFGCEAFSKKEQQTLASLAELFDEEPDEYQKKLREALKEGLSYPRARAKAACEYLSALSPAPGFLPVSDADAVLARPNNILAIEYMKALRKEHSPIHPVFISRRGDSYHSAAITDDYPSATALRSLMLSCRQTPSKIPAVCDALISHVPDSVSKLCVKHLLDGLCAAGTDYSRLLHYALLMSGKQLGSRFSQEPELARRIEHLLESYTDFDSFAQSVKTKNRTLTSVSRYLTQIMLGIDTEILNALRECAYAPYARVLGFRRNAAPLLDEIKKQARIPLITSLKDTPLLSEKKQAGSCLLMTDLRASEIYQIPFTGIDRTFQNDFRHPLIFL